MAIWKNIALILVLSAVSAIAEEERENVIEQLSTDVEQGRGRKRFYKFLIKALAPMLSNVISTVLLVKAKLFLVGIFLAGIYFFGHKIWPGGFCGHSLISDGPPPFFGEGLTGYHSTGPDIFSSYPGPESASYSYTPPPSSSISNAYLPPTVSSSSSSSGIVSSGYLPPNRRRGKRAVQHPENEELLENEMYWTDQLTDMAFRFLGVTSRTCRKRFVCEFDFHARSNPLILFVTRAMGRDIFYNYRDNDDEQASSYKDCGRIYAACAVPKKSVPHRRRRPTTTSTTESPTTMVDDDKANEIGGEDENTERSFEPSQLNDWQPLRVDPLKRLFIPLLSSARQN
ncbi:uncharacterized protein LOC135708190 [Ochlerotatus camptorhynchus]|uniref:uncharacterized protein LOC135708190 n=1 Tax=Ochlerotatus camptorhynchus TaxID=644619 RepID=UPI0031DCA58F